jgi:hypothetical protein
MKSLACGSDSPPKPLKRIQTIIWHDQLSLMLAWEGHAILSVTFGQLGLNGIFELVKKKGGNIVHVLNCLPRHEDVWESGRIAPSLLTSVLDGGEWSASRSSRFAPGNIAARWALEPVWMLWWREKSLAPAVNQTLAIQLVTRYYTDRAIPAHIFKLTSVKTGTKIYAAINSSVALL